MKNTKKRRVTRTAPKKLLVTLSVLLVVTVTGIASLTQSRASDLVADILSRHAPGVLHEGIPHGVPSGFDWRTKSLLKNISPPTSDMTYINLRGVVYTDESNIRPSNTRVELTGCLTYGLEKSSNTWKKIFDFPATYITGKGWKEDFSAPGTAAQTDIQTESDGYRSFTTVNGYNLHFFTNTNKVPIVNVGSKYRHFVSGCSTRLVLADPSGPDDRSQSHYMILVGHDWKTASNGCTTNSYGSTLCYSMGAGNFIYSKKTWRRVVYSTMDSTAIANEPRPPNSLFQNPDGTYGDGESMPPKENPISTPSTAKDTDDKSSGSGAGTTDGRINEKPSRNTGPAAPNASAKTGADDASASQQAAKVASSDKGVVQQSVNKIAQKPVIAGVLLGTAGLITMLVVTLCIPSARYAILRFMKLSPFKLFR